MDVAQWLKALGLGQYEALFREHEIDADVLPDLTEADLEKIGVPLGRRKRLMRAIAVLASNEAPPPARKPAAAAPSLPSIAISRAEAERRPITVMFCDLAGSTRFAAKLDAEDWRNLVGASRRGLCGGDGARRPCAEEARRRADGPLRLSAGAGEPGRLQNQRCSLRQEVFITAPSMTTPSVTYFHKAISSFRANATMIVLLRRPPLRLTRSLNHKVRADCGW